MMRTTALLVLGFAAGFLVVPACSSDGGGGASSSSGGSLDAGADLGPGSDAPSGADTSAPNDAASDAPADSPEGCEGACKTTTLTATFGAKSGPLDRAQHGIDHGDVADTLHVEAHQGGDPACPTASSPTPSRTFIVSGFPRTATAGATFTEADGVRAAFLDFKGDLLPNVPLTKSTKAKVSVIANDPANPPKWIAFDVDTTFAEGTVKGHAYSSYCASLDD